MTFRSLLLLVGMWFLLGNTAYAQVDIGAAVGPDALLGESTDKPDAKQPIYPLALAASLAFDATTWATLQISTGGPALGLSELMLKGYYNLELYQLLLMAHDSRAPLKPLLEDRDKGKRLREIAKGLGLNYDAVYDRSLKLDDRIRKELLPRILTVSISTHTAVSVALPERPTKRRRRSKHK